MKSKTDGSKIKAETTKILDDSITYNLNDITAAPVMEVDQLHAANVFKPRVWLITDCGSALGRNLAVEALLKGHYVAAACRQENVASLKSMLLSDFSDRLMVIELDPRNKPLCQSCVAEVVLRWHRIDVVVNCSNKSIVGTVEEASEWHVREQFESAFYGPVNIISTVLPAMRKQNGGHIICVTGLVGYTGTPSLGILSTAMHALEGYSEALAFEVASFNVKVTIVEPTVEEMVLANPAVFTRQIDDYKNTVSATVRSLMSRTDCVPDQLVKDSVLAIMSIAGIENPPGRIVAGVDAIEQIRDKLRTVSEEMEDMLEVSYAADLEPLTERQQSELFGGE
ncbi:hypothetical protein V1512DRAFT_265767 [Lipomyces arxii]|uniref:uncharacterized protein n=1 Tax=Lipomyces arxii TaxID=56418 RepID=UPI0034CF0F59